MRLPIVFLCLSLLCLSSLAAAQPVYHVLAKGETIYAVARAYKISPDAILKANGITDPKRLKVGQRLAIPRVHVVLKGETLFSIARSYSISVEALEAANDFSAKSVIVVGQCLILPPETSAGGKSDDANPLVLAPVSPPPEKDPIKAPASPVAEGGKQSVSPNPGPAFPPLVKTSSRAVSTKLVWPCHGEARYLDGKIEGIVILTERGVAAQAISSGRVVSAGPYRGFGQVVFVESKNGYIYVYGGNESIGVKVGDAVSTGQELGKVGYDAKEGRAVAYFFVFRNGESLDPANAPRG
jgi:murein DD-endopeptidase MepM/ murein hydrolase activator NlpD